MRLSLSPVLLAAALLLSGCVVEEVPTDATEPSQDPAPAADPPQQEPVPEGEEAATAPHGEPVVTEGAIESGMDLQQVPGAWARQTITVTNDFGGATLGSLWAAIAAGSITIKSEAREGYLVECVLESRAATEADARSQIERAELVHEDALDGATLRLRDHVEVQPPVTTPLPLPPGVTVNLGDPTLAVHFTIVVPVGPAIELVADAASGDISVEDLAGPLLDVSTASGDVSLASLAMQETLVGTASGDIGIQGLVADSLQVSTSSGDVSASDLSVASVSASSSSGDLGLEGTIDDLDVGTSSGDVSVDATPTASGGYSVSTASGDVGLALADEGPAYHVTAGSASGDIAIDLPGGEVIEDKERHKEVASPGFDDAAIQTTVDVATSSGDISVAA